MAKQNKVEIDITADAAELSPELKEAESDVVNFADRTTREVAARSNAILQGIGQSIGQLLMNTAGKAIRGVFAFFKAGVADVHEAEQAFDLLKGAIESSGHAAGVSAEQVKKWADQREAITNFTSEATQGVAAVVAAFENIRGENFIKTLEAAQNVATKTQRDFKSTAEGIAQAMEAPSEALSRLNRIGVRFTEEEQKVIDKLVAVNDVAGAQAVILERLSGSYSGVAETAADPLIKLGNAWGKLREEVSAVFSAIRDRVVESLLSAIVFIENNFLPVWQQVSEYISSIWDQIVEWAVSALSSILKSLAAFYNSTVAVLSVLAEGFGMMFSALFGGAEATFGNIMEVITNFMLTVQTIFEQLGTSVMIVATGLALAFVKAFEEVKHWAGVLWDYLKWVFVSFGKIVWASILQVKEDFATMVTNIKELWNGLMNWFKTGEWEVKLTPRSDLVKDAVKEAINQIPGVTAREKSALEQQLEANMVQYVSDWDKAFAKNKKDVDNMVGGWMQNFQPKEMEGLGDFAANDAAYKQYNKEGQGSKGAVSGVEGLEALYNRLTNASAKDPAKATEEAAAATQQVLEEVGESIVEAIQAQPSPQASSSSVERATNEVVSVLSTAVEKSVERVASVSSQVPNNVMSAPILEAAVMRVETVLRGVQTGIHTSNTHLSNIAAGIKGVKSTAATYA